MSWLIPWLVGLPVETLSALSSVLTCPSHLLLGSLTVGGTLGRRPLPSTPPDAHTVDNVALLGLVAQTAGLVRTRWAGSAVNDVQLAELN